MGIKTCQFLKCKKLMQKLHLRQRAAIRGKSPLSIHWWNRHQLEWKKRDTPDEKECVHQRAAPDTNWRSCGPECEGEIYNWKSRAGRVKENKKEICFEAKTYPSNITGLILGGDTEADTAMGKGEVSNRYLLYLESSFLFIWAWLVPPGPFSWENVRHHLLVKKNQT